MKTLIAILAVGVAIVAAAALVVLFQLRPPPPLAPPERGATLAGVTVIEPGLGRASDRTVRVEDDRIASVGAASPEEPADLRGGFVLPGLVDMHVHFPPESGLGQTAHFAALFLAHGVTSVRDAGDVDGTATAPARDGVAGGRFPGPRVFACGPFVDGPDPRWANSEVVRTPDEAEAAVDRIARAGLDCVKVYDGLSAEALVAVRAAARRHGLPVIGHVPRATRFETAGLDDVQHLTGIAGYPDGPPWPRNAPRWAQVDAGRRAALVAAARAHGTAVTPTLVALDRISHLDDPDLLRAEPDAALLPRFYRDVVWSPIEGIGPDIYAALRAALPLEARLVRELHDAGVPVHLGSDTLVAFSVPGASLHREMRLFRDQVGLAPEGIWALATRGNAAFLGVPQLGRLVAGAPADLLVFREDPTADLAALSTLEAVVADGRLYRRGELDAQIGRMRAYQDGPIVDWLSTTLVRRMLDRVRSDGAEATVEEKTAAPDEPRP